MAAPIIIVHNDVDAYMQADYASQSAEEKAFVLSAIAQVTSRICAHLEVSWTPDDLRYFSFTKEDFDWWPSGNLIIYPTPGAYDFLARTSMSTPTTSTILTPTSVTSIKLPRVLWGRAQTMNGLTWESGWIYEVRYKSTNSVTSPNPWNTTGWPEDVKLVAIEMVAAIISDRAQTGIAASVNLNVLTGTVTDVQFYSGVQIKLHRNRYRDWINRLQPFKRITI